MSLERHPTIADLWKIRFYPEGRKIDPKTGKPGNKRATIWFEGTEAAATDYYAQLMRSSRKIEKFIAPTIAQAWAEFCQYYKNHTSERTYNDFLLTWRRHLENYFGSYRPAMIKPGLFEAYKTKRAAETYLPGKRGQKPEDDTDDDKLKRKPISKRTVQKEITFMQSFLAWMTRPENNMALPLNFKINNYKASQTEAPIKIVPGRREMILLIRACRGERDKKYRELLAIAYYAGLRRSELFALSGKSIDLSSSFMMIKGKGEKTRTVPIVTKLKPYIKRAYKAGRLFSNPKTGNEWDNVDRLLERACKATGIDIISIHTFRHAFAVHSIMRGVSLRTLQIVMGHSSIKTTEKYLHLVPEELTRDLDHLARRNETHKKKERYLK